MNTLTFLLSTVIELYTMVLLLRIWMQWAHCDFYNPFSQFVVKVTQPIIGPLRRVIPAMGPIDSALAAGCLYSQFYSKPSCCLKW
ncbi:membrane protein YggT [Escherichia coli]|nr:membrane protein YggT [Escherichia coli]